MKKPRLLDLFCGAGGASGDERKTIMGMPWCRTIAEVNEAIPPAYAEWIGKQLIQCL